MDPQAKSPPKQTICIRLLSFVFYNENMQFSNFFPEHWKDEKCENQRFSQILIDTKTPVSLQEVKGSTTNLVQYNGVLEYSLCDTHIKILPSIKTQKREPPQQWILLKQLKTKLCWFLNIQQSGATVTQGKKDTVLKNPSSSKKGTLICIPYLTRQVSKS